MFGLVPLPVNAASFDCAKANSRVEKTICASPMLSRLDEQLAQAYASFIASSNRQDMLRTAQKKWLHEVRDRCPDEACLKTAYENRLGHLTSANRTEWKSFRDERLGVELSYPANRKVKLGCRENRNCVALVGKPMPNSDYLIAFEVFDGDLETIAEDKAVFRKIDGTWIARGRSGEHPAVRLRGSGWQGLKAVVDCGISDRQGFHGSAGECMWVVLSNGKRAVVADTQGIVGNDEASMRSIQSIVFWDTTESGGK
jgi:uncharacterized protein